MAAGVPQIIFGHPSLLGNNSALINRHDLFWAQSIEELEALVKELFSAPTKLRAGSVDPPPYWNLKGFSKSPGSIMGSLELIKEKQTLPVHTFVSFSG